MNWIQLEQKGKKDVSNCTLPVSYYTKSIEMEDGRELYRIPRPKILGNNYNLSILPNYLYYLYYLKPAVKFGAKPSQSNDSLKYFRMITWVG